MTLVTADVCAIRDPRPELGLQHEVDMLPLSEQIADISTEVASLSLWLQGCEASRDCTSYRRRRSVGLQHLQALEQIRMNSPSILTSPCGLLVALDV